MAYTICRVIGRSKQRFVIAVDSASPGLPIGRKKAKSGVEKATIHISDGRMIDALMFGHSSPRRPFARESVPYLEEFPFLPPLVQLASDPESFRELLDVVVQIDPGLAR